MSKLSTLYTAMEKLQSVGVTIDEDLERKVSKAEEDIIKEEILPVLEQKIEPALQEVKRKLVLVVDYKPGEPISVALSRKVKISDISDAHPITASAPAHDSDSSHEAHLAEEAETAEDVGQPVVSNERNEEATEPHEPTRQVLNPTKGLRVTFPDGHTICMSRAIDTFKAALRRIGFERVSELGLTHAGCNLVSRTMIPPVQDRVLQHEIDGWYVFSNISNGDKKKDLQTISDRLHLDLKIEDGKPEAQSHNAVTSSTI